MSVPVLSRLFVAQATAAVRREPPRVRPRRVSSSGSSTAAQGLGARPPGPNPQSQFFSRNYEPILPTSLIYIVLSTRGCSPWRPDAVMSTTWQDRRRAPGFSRAVGGAPNATEMQRFTSRWALSPDDPIPGPSSCQREKRTLLGPTTGVSGLV